ncbi:Detected protein of unknown function [Hibiscus syriacus]|uniref:ACT domain-containing protein n=1 Tax=Hibiscus syriacus TaxID=106335 RepID=A0A6A3ASF0_HIBSY|nr:Detected protein of unknown function [Hibiscus syriacus]
MLVISLIIWELYTPLKTNNLVGTMIPVLPTEPPPLPPLRTSSPKETGGSSFSNAFCLSDQLFQISPRQPTLYYFNIPSVLDKASVIKDAINYIQQLQLQEQLAKTQIEIMKMENNNNPDTEEQPRLPPLLGSHNTDVFNSSSSPIQLLQHTVMPMGDNTLLVSITCTKRTGTIVKLCQLFESLNLKIITANITALPAGTLLNTLTIEADEREKEGLKMQIETAIAALIDPHSHMMS